MNDNDGGPGGYDYRPVGDDLAPGLDPPAYLVRVATSALSEQMKSNGPGLVQKMHSELIDGGTL